jgi:beta-glucan synthesis-associated protein KRE6
MMCASCRLELMKHQLLLIVVCFLGVSQAHWIDPDTPNASMTTRPYTVHVPPKPTSQPSIIYDDDYSVDDDMWKNRVNGTIQTKKPKPTKKPTRKPTSAPSLPTAAPSASPSSTPGSYKLVFSDEFNAPGRTFHDGTDPRWTALDKNDYTNNAQHYYSPKNAYTNDDGELVIETEAADTDVIGFNDVKRKKTHVTKHFRSAMIQSWNKFCFTGGIIEAEVIMPGSARVGGLWPAFWLLGNLARHTYVGSSQHVWPWSETNCTKKSADSQLLTACHNVAHYGMKVGVGRGAPEIDIFEVQPGNVKANEGVFLEMPVGQPFASASFQVAPGLSKIRPGNGYWPGPGQWYDGLIGGKNSTMNIQFYGSYNHFAGDYDPAKSDYWSDALSFNQQLNESHFSDRHIYRLEWEPPTDERYGHLNWFLDGELVLSINGKSLFDKGLGKMNFRV